ncbi:MAG TPA: peptidase M48, partial [Candidatus Aminicenantes bacterium]|nr:peptidase M48 [Candidatus Aminicenantes bacterium]
MEKGVSVLTSPEKLSQKDKASLLRVAKALRSSFADITEEEEYYIGRSVAATILATYPALNNSRLTRYVNRVGQAVGVYSDRPEIFAGYHFLVLDSNEINAMAAPGGFIFITKGLLRLCRNEDMLAA